MHTDHADALDRYVRPATPRLRIWVVTPKSSERRWRTVPATDRARTEETRQ
jgi:hypothetical protein